MVFLTLSDFEGSSHTAVYSSRPEPVEAFLAAEADCLIADWQTAEALPQLLQLAETGRRLLVAECWQSVFPQAELIIPSSMSGGDLRQRFRQLRGRRCWLQLEPMRLAFSLPCPDGQGVPVSGLPGKEGFYSEALGCRYVHSPGQVILFDTAETLEQKILLAKDCGFQGFFQVPETSP